MHDLDLIKQLPKARVHFTVAPLDKATMKYIEPWPIPASARWAAIAKIKAAGVRVHVNVAPAFPLISDRLIDQFATQLAELQVDEFYVDPLMPYNESLTAIREGMHDNPEWPDVESIITDRPRYLAWKREFHIKWTTAWRAVAHLSPKTKPLMCDHETKMKVDMNTGEYLDWKAYDSYEDQ